MGTPGIKFHRWCAVTLTALVMGGCISVPEPERLVRGKGAHGTATSLESAQDLLQNATDEASVSDAIRALERVLENNPTNHAALILLGNLHILHGAAYETNGSAKKKAYRKALYYTEAAMLGSPKFAANIDEGQAVWEAADALGTEYVDAIAFWATALFYQFDECLKKPLKPFNLRWMRRAEKMLAVAASLDPDWGGGQLHFSYGIYYMMPAVVGGNMEKSEDCFDRAVDTGPDWLLNRWGRAKYFHRRNGNRDEFISDLEWVAAQDPAKADGPYGWNVYCQRDARELLREIDRHFD